jgi:hypothetical protein
MRTALALTASLAAACTRGPAVDPAPFAACAVPAGGFADPNVLFQGLDATLSGPVLAAGAGAPPEGCFDALQIGPQGVDVESAEAWWVQVADDAGTTWTVGVWLPGGPAGPAVEDAVSAELAYRDGGFSPIVAHLSLRDGDGALIAWVAEAGDLPELALPAEVDAAQGDVAGEDGDSCGTWASYDLSVTVAGETVDVPYGGVEAVGGLEVHHGGYDLQAFGEGCPDWYVSDVAVAIAPAG